MAIIKGGIAGIIAAYQTTDKRTSIYKLINNIKNKRLKSLKSPTEAQQKQRLKFRLMGVFLAHLKELTEIGYLFRAKRSMLTPRNIIAKGILKEGIIGEYPELRINYKTIELSSGRLNFVENPELMIKTKRRVQVSWENYDGDDQDSVVVFIYNETRDKGFCFKNVAKRADLKVDLQLTDFSRKDVLHGWVFLIDEGERDVSDSTYMNVVRG